MSRNHPTSRPRSSALRRDDRAVSPVVGAVLMLALVFLLVGVVQTTAIPAANAQLEFSHSEEVRADVVGLASTADRVADGGHAQRAMVALGFRYPTRLFFINPPPVAGTLRTTEARTVTIDGARAVGETRDYWNGTERSFETHSVVYAPEYNEYGSAPTTVFEPWTVYGRTDGRTLARTATDLVDGRRISLVALDGRYSRSVPTSVGVQVSPTSAPVRTVTVANGTDPITLTVPTGIRNDTWADLLADELAGPDSDGRVASFDCAAEPPEPCGELTLTLEPGTYELRLGEVGIGSGASEEPAAYLTDVEGNATAVTETGRQRLAVEARDRFDNPVSGVSVSANVTNGTGTVRPVTRVTDSDGRAAFVYRAPETVDGTGPVTVTAWFGADDAVRNVTFDLLLVDRTVNASESTAGDGGVGGGGAGDGGADGSTSAGSVATVGGSVDSGTGQGQGREVTFSLDADRSVTVTGISVRTQNALADGEYVEQGTTVDGSALPTEVSGEFEVALRDIFKSDDRRGSGNLGVGEFVDPASAEADLVVTVQFDDGSTLEVGIG